MKTIAIVQPYVFPYLPYYQLVAAVDEFWVLDDAQFIRRGWMNRNYILLGGRKHLFTLPVSSGRRDDMILEKTLPADFARALGGFAATIRHAYAKAPYHDRVHNMLENLIARRWTRFFDLAMVTLRISREVLGIKTPLYRTSSLGVAREIKGAERILAICARAGADHYLNPIGGLTLYDPVAFSQSGVRLSFLRGECPAYPQTGAADFIPGLSILDVVANLEPRAISRALGRFTVMTPGNGRALPAV